MIKQIYHFLHPGFQNLFMEYKVDFRPRYGHGLPPHKQLYDIINARRKNYAELLYEMLKYKDAYRSIKKMNEETNPDNPVYNNIFLPGLDIVGIYTIIAKFKPQTYYEIGSGNTTKVAFKAIKEKGLDTKIISVDPAPRAEIDRLADAIIREPFENTNLDEILSLKENDILFIDNSHRILPNSDATVFFLEVLPKLQKGVIVHIHDVYLPYDYPQVMCNRFYSEQYGLAMYLLADCNKYQPLLPNFFISEDEELRKIVEPIWEYPELKDVEKHGGSFWLTIQ